jgi:serine/threonine protein kinase
MPNGNLDTWLHEKSSGEDSMILGLGKRISMLVNVADALSYLHHDNERSIVHCDLKPSNILIDADMNAYLGDFGIASLVFNSRSTRIGHSSLASSSSISIGLKGTIGYIAPGMSITKYSMCLRYHVLK